MRADANRIKGCLLGLAAGDRIGGPIQMALTLAESLVSCQGFDLEDIGERYLAWWRESGFDTGPTSARVFRLVAGGKTYPEAAEIIDHQLEGMTAGCNPLHRCPPLALSPQIPDEDLLPASQQEAQLTHYHPSAGEGSGLVTSLIRSLIKGRPWEESLLKAAREQPDWILSIAFSKIPPTSQGGYTPDVLKAALYFLQTAEDFPEALERSLEFAGPANYSPVLVGALAGARWGEEGICQEIPDHNQRHLPTIEQLSEKLSRGWENLDV